MSDSAPTAEAEIHPVVAKLSDFPDRISPMIVKELRQGMRTRAFTSIFLILQVILGFSMFVALTSESGNIGIEISRMVFFLFSFVALILQPLRGTTAVSTELRDDTLEILSITRLSSFRIVFGKWASIVSQTALMLAATIPYLVMRYFFGGMQLFAELSLMGVIFLMSISLTGVTVGLSCNRAILIRTLIPLVLVPGGFSFLSAVFFSGGFREFEQLFSSSRKEPLYALISFVVMSLYIGYYFLDMGVSRIAAIAENHAFRKRMVSLGLMTVTLLGLSISPAEEACVFVALTFVVLIGIDVCSEWEVCVPSTVEPYVKRGKLGMFLGRFLYPGWHSGVFLLMVLFGVTFFIAEMTFPNRDAIDLSVPISAPIVIPTGVTIELALIIVGIFYTILTPLLVLRIVKNKITNTFTGYIGIMLGCGIATLLMVMLGAAANVDEELSVLLLWVPGMWAFVVAAPGLEDIGFAVQSFFLVIVWGVLVLKSTAEFRRTRQLEEYVAQLKRAQDHEGEASS